MARLIHLENETNNLHFGKSMRLVISPQAQFGEVNIADIQLDPKSRDDIPQLLRGLQHIYTSPELRERVFKILEEVRPCHDGAMVSIETGRPGMEQWKILVLGIIRLGLNIDYDRVHELANQHKTIREMLGHSGWFGETVYTLDTIKNNLRLFTPEILDRINQEVVAAGHRLVKKAQKKKSALAVTLLFSKRMCTNPQTSLYCWMQSARPSRSVLSCRKQPVVPNGARVPI